jgi:hypothetical protein
MVVIKGVREKEAPLLPEKKTKRMLIELCAAIREVVVMQYAVCHSARCQYLGVINYYVQFEKVHHAHQ